MGKDFTANNAVVRSMLVGLGIGDALGAAFEMIPYDILSTLENRETLDDYRVGIEGSLLKGHPPGTPTDDTAMVISVGRTLTKNGINSDRDDFVQGFQKDLVTANDEVETWFRKGGPGASTMRALNCCAEDSRHRRDNVTQTPGYFESGGNGTIMRVAPVATLADAKEVAQIARAQAEATHGHPSSTAAAVEVALRLHHLLNKLPLPEKPIMNDELLIKAWNTHVGRGERPLLDVPMSAWETAAGAWGICVEMDWDPAKVLKFAATSGGDTDTVAAVAGAFVGARIGDVRAFPGALLRGLLSRDVLMDLADGLTK